MRSKRLLIAFLLLVCIFAAGISGYMLIEHWGFLDSLYMTVITIASVGYMEVYPLSTHGRIFTIFLIILGAGVLMFGISTFTAFLVEGELNELLRRRKMEKQITKLKDHYIICGTGRIGKHIIYEMRNTKRPHVAIEKDEEACKELLEKEILHIKGDATSYEVLKAANIEHAKGLFCALPTDADNLLLILSAREINPRMRIISKANERESEHKMRKAGADGVVRPLFIGGLRMASEMVRPAAVNFLDKMLKEYDQVYRVEDIIISDNSIYCGKTLKDSGLLTQRGVTVVALKKGDKYLFNPSDEELFNSGDAVILIGETESIRKIKNTI